MSQTKLMKYFIFTALPCEAKPLVAYFKLKKDLSSHPFAVYHHEEMVLTVSGCGKIAMAAAVAYTLAKFKPSTHPVLVNVGIAGHQTATIGELFTAHKITDNETAKNFYPSILTQLARSSQTIYTVSRPQTVYGVNCLYDMEASSFYEIATRFTTGELIQVFKVVSDNQHTGLLQINAVAVSAWIMAQVEIIAEGIKQLQALASPLEIKESPYYAIVLTQWHFTANAKLQLKALLQRWAILTSDAPLNFSETELTHSKAVLHWLEQKINRLDFEL